MLHEHTTMSLAVDLVDLVDSKSRSITMSAAALTELILAFEALTSDAITSLRGCRVELISHKLMIAVNSPRELHDWYDDASRIPQLFEPHSARKTA